MRFRSFAPLALLWSLPAFAQTVSGYDPHLRAELNGSALTLKWNAQDGGPVDVYRRSDAGSFTLAARLDAGTTEWSAGEFPANEAREFRVTRQQTSGVQGEGFLLAGREVRFRDDQGEVAIVVDDQNVAANGTLIDELENDLRDDGWDVVRIVVAATDAPPQVKAKLQQRYEQTKRLRAAFLLGNVPFAYSGVQYPDGHADHRGAWPADPYYADLGDAGWTDTRVDGVGQFFNDAGDGKFDPNVTPSALELQVGRVSFERMPVYGADAGTVQVDKYLRKLHQYRIGAVQLPRGGRVQGNFGYFSGEAFSRVAWRDTTAVFGVEVTPGPLFPDLTADAGVILAWGDGAGSPTSAGGVVNSTTLSTSQPNAVFLGLFGSYFGDWSYSNNLLRAALGSGLVLETFWYARPYQYLHRLGAFESFGGCFQLGTLGRPRAPQVTEALLGDPTVRVWYLPKLSMVSAMPLGTGGVSLTWQPQSGVDGYHVFRQAMNEPPVRVTDAVVPGPTFTDVSAPAGTYEWRVVPAKLETTGSGTYWNHGLGARAVATVTTSMGGPDGGEPPDAGGAGGGAEEPMEDGGVGGGGEPDGGYSPLATDPQPGTMMGTCGCGSMPGGALLAALSLLLHLSRRGVRRTSRADR